MAPTLALAGKVEPVVLVADGVRPAEAALRAQAAAMETMEAGGLLGLVAVVVALLVQRSPALPARL